MNKKQKIITFTLLFWLFSANAAVFAAEALPDMSSPFDVPVDSVSSNEELPSLNKKAESSSNNETPPSLNIKVDTPKDEIPPKKSDPVPDDKKSEAKVVSASKVKTEASDMMDKGNEVTSDGAQVIAPKPKKVVKSGPEVAFLILPSLALGYLYNKRKK